MDITLHLKDCTTEHFHWDCILSLNFTDKTWSAKSALQPAIPGTWPGGLASQFSKYGEFEIKDSVIWIWDKRARTKFAAPEKINTLIIRDAPLSETDTGHASGTVRIFDAPSAAYKDMVFRWSRASGVAHVCGPDVTNKLIGVLRTVIEDYKQAGTAEAAGKSTIGMAWWNIDVLREKIARITPDGCGCPKGSPCEGSVTVFGKCFRGGIVNYTLYGVIQELTGTPGADALHALYWVGKLAADIATLEWSRAAEATEIGYLQSKMVNAGIAFARNGREAMRAEMLSIPSLPCAPCNLQPAQHGWKYTWAPGLVDRPSRY